MLPFKARLGVNVIAWPFGTTAKLTAYLGLKARRYRYQTDAFE